MLQEPDNKDAVFMIAMSVVLSVEVGLAIGWAFVGKNGLSAVASFSLPVTIAIFAALHKLLGL